MTTDDLTPFLTPQHQPGARLAQGRLVSWDPETFRSIVRWEGVLLRDLPVLAGATALSFREGDTLVLVGMDSGGRRGGQDWGILAKAIDPGDNAAEQAIEFMTSALGSAVSAGVIADRMHGASVDSSADTDSGTYVALTDGPEVSEVDISEKGVAFVGVQANISINNSESSNRVGFMSYEVSGATSRVAADADAFVLGAIHADVMNAAGVNVRSMAWSIQTGLTPGSHTFATRYRAAIAGGAQSIHFSARRIIVIGF